MGVLTLLIIIFISQNLQLRKENESYENYIKASKTERYLIQGYITPTPKVVRQCFK